MIAIHQCTCVPTRLCWIIVCELGTIASPSENSSLNIGRQGVVHIEASDCATYSELCRVQRFSLWCAATPCSIDRLTHRGTLAAVCVMWETIIRQCNSLTPVRCWCSQSVVALWCAASQSTTSSQSVSQSVSQPASQPATKHVWGWLYPSTQLIGSHDHHTMNNPSTLLRNCLNVRS